jgi:hypothetical protein
VNWGDHRAGDGKFMKFEFSRRLGFPIWMGNVDERGYSPLDRRGGWASGGTDHGMYCLGFVDRHYAWDGATRI